MQASAGFVSASALGMACGPALAGLFQCHFKVFNMTFNQETLPGWAMAVGWLLYLTWLWISFREPSPEKEASHMPKESNEGMLFSPAINFSMVMSLRVQQSLHLF